MAKGDKRGKKAKKRNKKTEQGKVDQGLVESSSLESPGHQRKDTGLLVESDFQAAKDATREELGEIGPDGYPVNLQKLDAEPLSRGEKFKSKDDEARRLEYLFRLEEQFIKARSKSAKALEVGEPDLEELERRDEEELLLEEMQRNGTIEKTGLLRGSNHSNPSMIEENSESSSFAESLLGCLSCFWCCRP